MSKSRAFSLTFLLCCILLSSCGNRAGGTAARSGRQPGMEALYELTERTAYLDVTVMSRQTVCPGQEWPGQTPEGYSPAFLDTVFY